MCVYVPRLLVTGTPQKANVGQDTQWVGSVVSKSNPQGKCPQPTDGNPRQLRSSTSPWNGYKKCLPTATLMVSCVSALRSVAENATLACAWPVREENTLMKPKPARSQRQVLPRGRGTPRTGLQTDKRSNQQFQFYKHICQAPKSEPQPRPDKLLPQDH